MDAKARGVSRVLMEKMRWERWLFALLACSLIYQVLCEPIVGTADNRDFARVMIQLGIDYTEDHEPTMFVNVPGKFAVGPRHALPYLTTQVPIGLLARGFNALLSKDGLFDIRMMGLANGLLYLGAVWAFFVAFARRSPWVRLCVGLGLLPMFWDLRIVSYFNSFYSESAQVIGLVATLAFALLANEPTLDASKRVLAYWAFFASALAFCLAKSQNLAFAPALGLVAYVICPVQPWQRALRTSALVALVLLTPCTMMSGAYDQTLGTNARVALEQEILPHSPDPDADRAALKPPGTRKVTLRRVAKFYVERPARWWSMASRRTKETHSYLELGNFQRPLSGVSHAFDTWGELKRAHYPRHLGAWVLAGFLYTLLLAAKWRKHDRTREQRNQTLLHAALLIGLVLQFVVVVTFEANGTEKHFFIFNVLADLLCVFAVLDVVAVAQRAAWPAFVRQFEARGSTREKDVEDNSALIATNGASESTPE